MIKNLTSGLLALSLAAITTASTSSLHAAVIDLSLNGTTSYGKWDTLNSLRLAGTGSFPGNTMWTPIASNHGNDDAVLKKISNGSGGGPYVATESIYYGGFSGDANLNGGTMAVADDTPLANLKTLVFQIDIGEAFTYDFFNHETPLLSYTTANGTFNLEADYTILLSKIYSTTVSMPTGPDGEYQDEDVFRNTWLFQWNLNDVTEPITSFEIQFTGVQHAQVYALQLDQSDYAYNVAVIPEPSTWSLLLVIGTGTVILLRRKTRLA